MLFLFFCYLLAQYSIMRGELRSLGFFQDSLHTPPPPSPQDTAAVDRKNLDMNFSNLSINYSLLAAVAPPPKPVFRNTQMCVQMCAVKANILRMRKPGLWKRESGRVCAGLPQRLVPLPSYPSSTPALLQSCLCRGGNGWKKMKRKTTKLTITLRTHTTIFPIPTSRRTNLRSCW